MSNASEYIRARERAQIAKVTLYLREQELAETRLAMTDTDWTVVADADDANLGELEEAAAIGARATGEDG